MTADTRFYGFRMALLASLGLLPFAACGGSSVSGTDDGGQAGAPPEGTGGSGTGGGSPTVGGGVGSGGSTPIAGSTGTGGGVGGSPIDHPRACNPVSASAGGAASGEAPSVAGASSGADRITPRPSIVHCEGGWKHRPAATSCPSALPRPEPVNDVVGASCNRDADCTEQAHGWCGTPADFPGAGPIENSCQYGCVQDSDCNDGSICQCGSFIGTCVRATCTTDADCGDGLLCASYTLMPGCNFPAFACQRADDECTSDADCGDKLCTLAADGHRVCQRAGCVIGRPFLIEGEERLAEAGRRRDWLEVGAEPELAGLTPSVRERLAAAWTRVGLMEHASIAAFARFTLELLAFGAPAELVASAGRAMSDETEHAKLAFALASAYAGAPVGPGPLCIDGSLNQVELEPCVVNAFLEGCLGETVAALEAREAAELASDPAVRSVLLRVADEEARHALLAFEFVKWALPRASASLRRALEATLETELERAVRALETAPKAGPGEAELVAHGVLPERRRRELRRSVLSEVVAPCVAEVLRAARELALPSPISALHRGA